MAAGLPGAETAPSKGWILATAFGGEKCHTDLLERLLYEP